MSQERARRAVACKGWRWMPGMLPLVFEYGEWTANPRLDSYTEESMWVSDKSVPDLTDPATLGCLLALVREAWVDPWVHVEPMSRRRWRTLHSKAAPFCAGPTEAAALVAALEAAP